MRLTPRSLMFAFVATAILNAPLAAQSRRAAEWGVIAGPSISNMKGDDANPALKTHTGIMAGVSFVLAGATTMALEVDALYVSKGFKSTGRTGYFELGTGFLEVPVLWRIQRPATSGRVQPFVVVGPALGVRLSCGFDSKSNGASSSMSCEEFTKTSAQDIASVNASGVIGGGVALPAGSARLTVGARYTRAFTSVLKNADNHFEGVGFYLGVSRGRRK